MAERIIMPQGGHDLKYGMIVHWLKREGEPVQKGELLCEVETEKAVFEVNAPRSGVLLKILKQDGEEAEVLSTIGFIGDVGEEITIEKEKSNEKHTTLDVNKKQVIKKQTLQIDKVKISPRARKLARDHSLDISQLQSTRPDGKITTENVQKAIRLQSGKLINGGVTGGREVKIGKIQGITANRLSQSWKQAPHLFVSVSVDMTDLIALREKINRAENLSNISINDLIISAVAGALKEFPKINATYKDENTVIEWDDINIGIATATDQGLLVPVLENADQLSLSEISSRVQGNTIAAREGRLNSNAPSRFTISNLGMHDINQFTAIINPPESAILAVASIIKKPVATENGEVVVREIMKMTLSLDHRVGNGILAVKFINHIKRILEDPISNGLLPGLKKRT